GCISCPFTPRARSKKWCLVHYCNCYNCRGGQTKTHLTQVIINWYSFFHIMILPTYIQSCFLIAPFCLVMLNNC
uniref:Uncharacterized protein n=1 Tax=Amphimedon queenslandica TaxID=400682 RepID=A0A1X7VU63_AMPQE